MAAIQWDERKQHIYETGVDHGVFYDYDSTNDIYTPGHAWNGLIDVSLNPEGGEPSEFYADNIKYLALPSIETFGFSIRSYTYPDEFKKHDGTVEIAPGVYIGQQLRSTFGFAFRTLVGDEIDYDKRGYKLHLIYGAVASPTTRDYETKNDSPSPNEFEWECDTTPVNVTGHAPTSIIELDSTKVDRTKLAALETILYGDATNEPRLPMPDEIATMFATT